MEDCYIARCATEFHEQKYMEFLLEHYEGLGLPYSFSTAFSFISSPLLIDGETFLIYNSKQEAIGAFGFIYGSGANQYEDREIVQLQIVYLKESYRGTQLFLRCLQYLIQHFAEHGRTVKELYFWAPSESRLRRLFSKIAERRSSVKTVFGELDEYAAALSSIQSYVSRFRSSPHLQS